MIPASLRRNYEALCSRTITGFGLDDSSELEAAVHRQVHARERMPLRS